MGEGDGVLLKSHNLASSSTSIHFKLIFVSIQKKLKDFGLWEGGGHIPYPSAATTSLQENKTHTHTNTYT